MRTTLNIDDDVLQAAQELAEAQNRTAGEVISALARHSLPKQKRKPRGELAGLPQIPGGRPVTVELVERLAREE